MRIFIRKLIRELVYKTRFSRCFFPRYTYGQQPIHLCKLIEYIDQTRNVDGNIVEIGCLVGSTTIFLNKHLQYRSIQKKYYAIDTFDGFTTSDLYYEKDKRGKSEKEMKQFDFEVNSKKWFDQTMRNNQIDSVISIAGDINTLDISLISKVAFCLIDVDLYNPVKTSLNKIYPLLTNGGIIVVDDCVDNILWDGAYQAYCEFCRENRIDVIIVENRYGVIEKHI